jgi:hypothetical protein
MTFIVDGTNGLTFPNSSTQASAGLPLSGGNLSGSIAFTASNAGITFANSSALTNSQLNDYETGTWTPTINRSSTTTTATYATQQGSYTKIGRMVYITCDLQVTGISVQGSGYNVITGLPFPVVITGNAWGPLAGAVYYNTTFSASNAIAMGSGVGNANYISFTATGSGRTNSEINENWVAGYLVFSACYLATF